jgi:glycosyltransferase involved in cell wall biosynthesis
VLRKYSEFDVFVFPSLHDTGGFAVIEAMFNELPVICLDCGGPAVAVREGCGMKVPVRSRKEIVKDLAEAIKLYSSDPELLRRQGKAAREVILKEYDWERKGEEMNRLYDEVLSGNPPPRWLDSHGSP